MSEFNKYSTDGGATFIDVEDSNAVHYADNSVLGAKNWNLFPYHNTTKTYADITYTVEDDGVIDVNGTSTGEGQFDIHNINEMPNLLHDVTYILSGAPNVAYSTNDVRLRLITFKDDNTGRVNYDCPQGGEIQFTIPTGHHFHQLAYYIASGKTLNHVKVKPMIRLASDPDSTYTQGAMTNRELTDALTPIEGSFDYTHTASSTTPSPNTGRTHIFNVGKIAVASLWVTNWTISSGSWKEICRTTLKPKKETVFPLFMGGGKTDYGRIDTNGVIAGYFQDEISAGEVHANFTYILA